MTNAVFFNRPSEPRLRLEVEPALASWDKAGSPGQQRLHAFIDHVRSLTAGHIEEIDGSLAVSLEVGLPATVPLYAAHDLDNYLLEVVRGLTKHTGRQFASAWATKRHAPESFLSIAPATAVSDRMAECRFDIVTTASAERTAFKEQIRDQVAPASPLPGLGVALQLGFVVGPGRFWPNLWKPTIDALGPILGRDEGAREWNARDGRITELGLHCSVDPDLGHQVQVAIRASADATAELFGQQSGMDRGSR